MTPFLMDFFTFIYVTEKSIKGAGKIILEFSSGQY